jgi:hypothetical protein
MSSATLPYRRASVRRDALSVGCTEPFILGISDLPSPHLTALLHCTLGGAASSSSPDLRPTSLGDLLGSENFRRRTKAPPADSFVGTRVSGQMRGPKRPKNPLLCRPGCRNKGSK